jgi:hypothetical protein
MGCVLPATPARAADSAENTYTIRHNLPAGGGSMQAWGYYMVWGDNDYCCTIYPGGCADCDNGVASDQYGFDSDGSSNHKFYAKVLQGSVAIGATDVGRYILTSVSGVAGSTLQEDVPNYKFVQYWGDADNGTIDYTYTKRYRIVTTFTGFSPPDSNPSSTNLEWFSDGTVVTNSQGLRLGNATTNSYLVDGYKINGGTLQLGTNATVTIPSPGADQALEWVYRKAFPLTMTISGLSVTSSLADMSPFINPGTELVKVPDDQQLTLSVNHIIAISNGLERFECLGYDGGVPPVVPPTVIPLEPTDQGRVEKTITFNGGGGAINWVYERQIPLTVTFDASVPASVKTLSDSTPTHELASNPHWIAAGSTVDASIASVVIDGSVRWVADGWTLALTGGPTFTNVLTNKAQSIFILTNKATLTWKYRIQRAISVAFEGLPSSLQTDTNIFPSVGVTYWPNGSIQTATAPLVIIDGATRYRNVGWLASGDIVASGTTNVTPGFTVNQDSTITWRYEKDYALDIYVTPTDRVDVASAIPGTGRTWIAAGQQASASAIQSVTDDGTNFTMLKAIPSGSADGAPEVLSGGRKSLTWTMSGPASVIWPYKFTEVWDVGQMITPPTNHHLPNPPDIEIIVEDSSAAGTTAQNSFHYGGPTGLKKLYPLRPIVSASVIWKKSDGTIAEEVPVIVKYPTNQQLHVAGVPVDLTPPNGGFTFYDVRFTAAQATESDGIFSADQSGKSVLQYIYGGSPDPVNRSSRFVVVNTVFWDDPDHLVSTNWYVGPAITNEFHQEIDERNGYVFYSNAYFDASVYDRANRLGPILPVNTDVTSKENDQMVVVWYSQGDAQIGVYWPTLPYFYDVQWPSNSAPRIYIANGKGAPGNKPQASIYNQPNPNLPGFNPNEEHAAFFDLGGQQTLFALRNDINYFRAPLKPYSEPYVLMKYKDALADEWMLDVYKVETENSTNTFDYPIQAGFPVFPPYPMSVIPLQPKSSNTSGQVWYFRDHKDGHWAKAAGSGTNQAVITMHWFYPFQQGFFIPDYNNNGEPDLVAGDPTPFLNGGRDIVTAPSNVRYQVSWPTNAAVLAVGETLTRPKFGLPDVFAQASTEVIFDENVFNGGGPLVKLIDPISERSVPLAELPASILTEPDGGRVRFKDLPYYLKARLSYDTLNKRLYFGGVLDESGVGEPLLLLNVMSTGERDFLQGFNADWAGAIGQLYDKTINPNGLLFSAPVSNPFNPALTNSPQSFVTLWGIPLGLEESAGKVKEDRIVGLPKALSAGSAKGEGWVTIVENNDESLGAAPVALHVIRVAGEPYVGEIKVIESDNVFDEKLTMRHSGDFGGEPDKVVFEWWYKPDTSGFAPGLPDNQAPPGPDMTGWFFYNSGAGMQEITIEGASPLTLADNWFVCRYNFEGQYGFATGAVAFPVSKWAGGPGNEKAQLSPGWIKRVVAGLNPFDARVKDFHESAVNTIVSMIAQAGNRFEGPIAFNSSACNLNNLGMIEAYDTVLNRAQVLSIDSGINYGPANAALLNISTRLADLYMLLGNEAFQDAIDPTIGFGTDSAEYGSLAPAIFTFQNQVASLLEEELVLLRGRDDTFGPVRAPPVYNRFFWNFTQGDGEVAYVNAYNISDQKNVDTDSDGCADDTDGIINEDDAKYLYPQGHGDAWGHYLQAIKYHYGLLRHPNYNWEPRPESVLVGGAAITIDYLDERKFATMAAARARIGNEIVNLTYRLNYVDDPSGQWQGYKDTDRDRAWGVDDWARRAGMGAYFDWVVGNAILPYTDPNTNHTGIAQVDRFTVKEFKEINSAYQAIQEQVSNADKGLNPLGLAKGVVPFDIDPSLISPIAGIESKTHFEQVYDRAIESIENALVVFDYANELSQRLRENEDDLEEFNTNINERERDFLTRLIEIFGYPYPEDIGPGGVYASGYEGPDWIHFMYVDPSELTGVPIDTRGDIKSYTIDYNFTQEAVADKALGLTASATPVTFTFTSDGSYMVKPPEWTGVRRAPGEIQLALSDLIQAKGNLEKSLAEYDAGLGDIDDAARLLQLQFDLLKTQIQLQNELNGTLSTLDDEIKYHARNQLALQRTATLAEKVAGAVIEGLSDNKVVMGTMGPYPVVLTEQDPTKAIQVATLVNQAGLSEVFNIASDAEATAQLNDEIGKEQAERSFEWKVLTQIEGRLDLQDRIQQVQDMVGDLVTKRMECAVFQEQVQQAMGRYLKAVDSGKRLMDERAAWRKSVAPEIQEMRYQDMAFRIFRNEALQKYRAQFDLAAKYVYLAATAYDYETNLLGDDDGSGQEFLTDIVRHRGLGQFLGGLPVAGQPGLADPLARLSQNFAVYKTQMGFNNPQTETARFSLRKELFRIKGDAGSDAAWRQILREHLVADLWALPEYKRFCRPFAPESQGAQPGLVFRFPSTIQFGQNFFGWPLGGGDSTYDPTHFATKIRSVGLWFENYNGQGLAFTPRVYLVPVGADIMRAPNDNDLNTREWTVLDQVIPVPFPIGVSDLEDDDWSPINDSLSETFGAIRRFSRFRAYHDSGVFDPDETVSDSRLIGRSVWNTDWMLIIPGETLLNPATEGLLTFIDGQPVPGGGGVRDGNGIKDIKLFFQTYSYSGN